MYKKIKSRSVFFAGDCTRTTPWLSIIDYLSSSLILTIAHGQDAFWKVVAKSSAI